MFALVQNMQEIKYKLYEGIEDAVDSNGFKTGEKVKKYSDPVTFRVNVSSCRGNSTDEVFGKETDYDRTIVTTDMDCPIDEYSILWVDREITEPHNYCVKKVAKSLNSISYAIKETNVS